MRDGAGRGLGCAPSIVFRAPPPCIQRHPAWLELAHRRFSRCALAAFSHCGLDVEHRRPGADGPGGNGAPASDKATWMTHPRPELRAHGILDPLQTRPTFPGHIISGRYTDTRVGGTTPKIKYRRHAARSPQGRSRAELDDWATRLKNENTNYTNLLHSDVPCHQHGVSSGRRDENGRAAEHPARARPMVLRSNRLPNMTFPLHRFRR